ncbi:pseudouridine synthase [Luteimicrobium subarcticum]|uniref:RNA pseudouridylate synthase n=1 Tax=Luteimicrobium subarcticum TaxID=620910 RepID=A0A2M8WVD0_9MICO|nr:pseudouridine synthase [Luteimicrobium subarcticum]PJI94877.1 tRNA pseudouridine32 synthase / 23S rRNA pseudouridine746 synthase [Luteimicrobium subarcticum]
MPRSKTPAPLPVRDGLNPTRLRLPDNVPGAPTWATVLDYLIGRFPDDAARLREKVDGGEVVLGDGSAVTPETPFRHQELVYLYRDPPVEPALDLRCEVLHHDDDLLVVDKPHFLATIPRGSYIARSALVQLRRELDLPELTPIHRLDRVTAGVVIFTTRAEVRRPYHRLLDDRALHKEYAAVASVRDDLDLPATVRSRIVKERGVVRAQEVAGEPNAESRVELLDVADDPRRGPLGLYRLTPRTGKTHQLRLHMQRLGVPIVDDPFYPELRGVDPDDHSAPLQLLARAVELTDPLSGERRRFVSRRTLAAWPGRWPDGWDRDASEAAAAEPGAVLHEPAAGSGRTGAGWEDGPS